MTSGEGPSILVVGETIVDMHPTETAGTYTRRLGGAPANVACGLAQLGVSPELWTRVGAGPLGEFLRDRLTEAGVGTRFLTRDPTAPTGLAMVTTDADGDRSFTLYLDGAASTRLQPGRVDDETLASLDWLHVGGVELAHEPARSAVRDLLECVPASVTVSLDPNYRADLWAAASGEGASEGTTSEEPASEGTTSEEPASEGTTSEVPASEGTTSEEPASEGLDYETTLKRVLPAVDCLIASVEDLTPAGYEGEPTQIAQQLTADGPHTVFCTRGADGAVAVATDAAPWGPAEAGHAGFDVAVTDTTGAGDAFTAGVIATLTGSFGPVELTRAVRVGCAVGAVSVTGRGAVTALPERAQVERLLGE